MELRDGNRKGWGVGIVRASVVVRRQKSDKILDAMIFQELNAKLISVVAASFRWFIYGMREHIHII